MLATLWYQAGLCPQVLQFDQMSSSRAGVFFAAGGDTPTSSFAASTRGDTKKTSPPPVVLAFWLSFSYSEGINRYYSMHGLPAPVVCRAVARIRRDLKMRKKQKQKQLGVAPSLEVPQVEGNAVTTAVGAAEAATGVTEVAADGGVESSVPGTRVGIGLDGAKESLGAAPCLPVELTTVALSKARAGLGLSEAWSRKVEDKCGKRQKQV